MTNQSKDIQSKWLTTLPSKWTYGRVKQLFRLRSQQSVYNHGLELLSVYTHIGVRPRKDLEQRGNKASNTNGYWIVKKGDLISNKLLAWMGAIGVSHYEGVTSPAYDVLYPIQACNTDYYHYLFRTNLYLQKFKSRSRGIMDMRLRLYFDQFGQILVPIPPLEVQNNIANYLNLKTNRINRIIARKKQLITLLKEQKQVIINKAVTRGLDPNVRLKPSGLDWLSDIPAHWNISRLRNIAAVRASGVDKHTVEGESPVRLCNYVDVYKNNEITDELDFMKASATPAEIANFKLLRGDVIITKDSEDWKDIGIPAYVPQNIDNLICGYHLSLIRPYNDLIDGMFLYTSLLSEAVADQFRISATGVTRFGLSQGSIKDVQIPLPPIAEQKAISEYVKIKNESINQVIGRTQKEIQLIQEYRTRLISDVVTGQLDVRNIEISDIAEEDYIEETLEEEQEEESLELVGASDDD